MTTKPKYETPTMLMKVTPRGLVPATEFDDERYAALKKDEIIHVALPRARKDERLHRKYHAVLRAVAEAIGKDKEVLRSELKYATGRVHSFVIYQDEVQVVGLSETEMNAEEFAAYANAAIEYIALEILQADSIDDVWALGKSTEPKPERQWRRAA